jgi:hypothetical protein
MRMSIFMLSLRIVRGPFVFVSCGFFLIYSSSFGRTLQNQNTPALSSIAPGSGLQGATIRVALRGDGFVPGNTQMFFSDDGIVVLKVDVASSTTATATLVLSGTAGEKRALVRTPSGLSQPVNFTITPSAFSGLDYRAARFAGTDAGLVSGIGSDRTPAFMNRVAYGATARTSMSPIPPISPFAKLGWIPVK